MPITNLTFFKEYTAAVEAKQVAQQEAEHAKLIVSVSSPCICALGNLSWGQGGGVNGSG